MEHSEIRQKAEVKGIAPLSELELEYIYSEIAYTESIKRKDTDLEHMKRHIDTCERFEADEMPRDRKKKIVGFAMNIIEEMILNYYDQETG